MPPKKPDKNPEEDDFINNLKIGTDEFELNKQEAIRYYVHGPGSSKPIEKLSPGLRRIVERERKKRDSKDQEQ